MKNERKKNSREDSRRYQKYFPTKKMSPTYH